MVQAPKASKPYRSCGTPPAHDFLTRFYATDESPGVVKTDNEEYIDFSRTRSLILVTSRNGVA